MLRTFPFSLSEEAKTWLNELDEGTITSWNELKEAFISRYFYPAKFRRLLKEVHNFDQLEDETLTIPTQGIPDAGGIFLYNTPNEAFKILDDKVLLKLDFSDDSQINPKIKTVVSIGGSNVDPDHAILMEKFETLATKINSEFLKIKEDLEEM
ncbi:reverse transcriptase domain-containing protein [Tanacetum coccineum]